MSAICGIFHRDGKPVDPRVLERMITTLSHRGPDGSGAWREGPVGLGHLMLHTTPESLREKLPLQDPSADLVITADARIDNRDELFDAFCIPHSERAAIPDSTLILKAYEKWGEECPKSLLGDFVFAIWDGRRRRLFCARDHMGLRPFYYYSSPRVFAFASEIKGILAVPDVPRRLNEIAIADFLVHNEQDLETTFYEEILRLPPSSILVHTGEEFKILRYWSLELRSELSLSLDEDYAETLKERMVQAVHCRMRSAFPVGVTLSGGLDSSSAACIAARKLREEGQRLIAVSSALPENHPGIEKDEREYIREVQRQEDNIDLEYVLAEGATPFDDLEGQFRRIDQPFIDLFYYMSDALYAAAMKHKVRILLGGFGGDMAASYKGKGYMAQLARTRRWRELARLLRQCATVEGGSAWAIMKDEVFSILVPPFARKVYHYVRGNLLDGNGFYHSAIHPAFARRVGIVKRSQQIRPLLGDRESSYAHAMMLSTLKSSSLTDSLECLVASSSAFGLECLHPLLDRRIIEFCMSLPPDNLIKKGWRRRPIRDSMKDILPPKVRWRATKHPFSPDYHSRMLNAKRWVVGFLSETDSEDRIHQYVDKAKIERQLKLVRPARGWNDWDSRTPGIVGKGVIVESFRRWFIKNVA